MKTFEIEKDFSNDLYAFNIDALIRIRDYSGFFDSDMRRLRVLLYVASNCEVHVSHLGTVPDVIISLGNPEAHKSWNYSPSSERNSFPEFYREVIRVGLLLEKLILLIDPQANVKIDYPDLKEIIDRSISNYEDFLKEFPEEGQEECLSTNVSDELHESISSFVGLVIPRQNYMLGTCHWIWNMKKCILRYGFNLDWKTPSEEHPDVLFD